MRNDYTRWGLMGGGQARANEGLAIMPSGEVHNINKATHFLLPKGAVLNMKTGGGGGYGYGDPGERPLDAVHKDLEEGYISEPFARRHYPHTFVEPSPLRQ